MKAVKVLPVGAGPVRYEPRYLHRFHRTRGAGAETQAAFRLPSARTTWSAALPSAWRRAARALQVSLLGHGGVLGAWEEGLEVNVLGLSFGVDVKRPALNLPVTALGVPYLDLSRTPLVATGRVASGAGGALPDPYLLGDSSKRQTESRGGQEWGAECGLSVVGERNPPPRRRAPPASAHAVHESSRLVDPA